MTILGAFMDSGAAIAMMVPVATASIPWRICSLPSVILLWVYFALIHKIWFNLILFIVVIITALLTGVLSF